MPQPTSLHVGDSLSLCRNFLGKQKDMLSYTADAPTHTGTQESK